MGSYYCSTAALSNKQVLIGGYTVFSHLIGPHSLWAEIKSTAKKSTEKKAHIFKALNSIGEAQNSLNSSTAGTGAFFWVLDFAFSVLRSRMTAFELLEPRTMVRS